MNARPNSLFHALRKIGDSQHATDDHGFPICQCDPCRAKSKRMNDAYLAKAMGWVPDTSKDHHYDGQPMELDGWTEKTL